MKAAWRTMALALTAVFGGGHAVAQGGGSGPACRIDAEPTGSGVALSGHATAPEGWSGRYSLTVRKLGPSGQSNISQGGALTLEPARESRFGHVALSLEPGARYDAVLTITADGTSVECRAAGSGAPQ